MFGQYIYVEKCTAYYLSKVSAHIMVEEVLDQWSAGNLGDLHLAVSIRHTETGLQQNRAKWNTAETYSFCDAAEHFSEKNKRVASTVDMWATHWYRVSWAFCSWSADSSGGPSVRSHALSPRALFRKLMIWGEPLSSSPSTTLISARPPLSRSRMSLANNMPWAAGGRTQRRIFTGSDSSGMN